MSTDEQGESGLGLAAQEHTIRTACELRDLHLQTLYKDVASGKSRAHRPNLAAALDDVAEGRADVLVVAKLDRLARSVLDFCTIAAQAEQQGWNLLVLDPPVDFTDPAGRLLAQIMAAFAEWERLIIAKRTHEAMQAAKRRGAVFGRQVSVGSDVRQTIVDLRTEGLSYDRIAKRLTNMGVPTGQGGRRWYASTVRAVEKRPR